MTAKRKDTAGARAAQVPQAQVLQSEVPQSEVPQAEVRQSKAPQSQVRQAEVPPDRQHLAVPGDSSPEADRAPGHGEFLIHMAGLGLQEVVIAGLPVRPGSRVRLAPHPGGDVMSQALAGRVATVEAIDEDDTGSPHVAVVVDDHAAQGWGGRRHPAHRFFFRPDELEPLEEEAPRRRVLVAGIGNIFLGDDGFGVAVAQRLLGRDLPPGIEVVDFGIRGRDLAYALGQEYCAAILVDAVPGEAHAGTLVVMEAKTPEEDTAVPDGHRMDPVSVLKFARHLGRVPERVLVVGCVPREIGGEWNPETTLSLSKPVAEAVVRAADLVEQLAAHLLAASPPASQPSEETTGVMP